MSIPAHRVVLVQFFADLIKEHHGVFNSVLDVGCGELQSIWRQRWGDKYEGLDNRDSVGAHHVGDACDLSRFKSNSVDVVTAWSAIEHVKHPYTMLEEMKRVCTGTCILTTDYVPRDKDGDQTHLYSWTLKTLTQLIKSVHKDCKIYESRGIAVAVMYRCQDG